MRRALRALDRYWFAPAPLRDLAVVRIVVVASQLLFFLPSLDHQLWLAGVDRTLFQPLPALKVLLLPLGGWGVRPDPMFLHAVWLLAIVAGICAVIGRYTRPSMLAFAAANTLLIAHEYSYGEYHHPQALLVIALWVLALAPVGAAYSLDDLRTRVRVALGRMRFEPLAPTDDLSIYARWPLRVIQWLLVLAYLSAALSKLTNSGLDWFNGYTLSYYFVQDGLRWGNGLGLWLSRYVLATAVLAVGAVLFELTFAVAALVPRAAWLYVAAGTGMHTAIYFAQHAPFFQYIVLYIAFIEELKGRLPHWLRATTTPAGWTVIYDGLCPRCIRSMVVLDYLDLGRELRFVDLEREQPRVARLAPGISLDQTREAMHVIGPDGRVYRGFFAFRALARILPPLWPLLPLFYAPLAGSIGARLYDGMARSRRRVTCRAVTCHI